MWGSGFVFSPPLVSFRGEPATSLARLVSGGAFATVWLPCAIAGSNPSDKAKVVGIRHLIGVILSAFRVIKRLRGALVPIESRVAISAKQHGHATQGMC